MNTAFMKLSDGTYEWGAYTIEPARYAGTSTRYHVYRRRYPGCIVRGPQKGVDTKYYRARTLEDAKQVVRDCRAEDDVRRERWRERI